jgi:hypothetical protein
MKRLLVLLAFLPVAAFAQQPQAAPDITISANGATNINLYQGWPLIVDVTIMNSLRFQGGSAPLLVVAPASGNWTDAIQLTATSSSGNTFQWPFKLAGSPSTPTLTLDTNSYVTANWQISSSDTLALPPDTYQLTAAIQITSTTGWSGTSSTSPVSIQVGPEPTLTQDQQQLKTLLVSEYQTNTGDLDGALTTVEQYLNLNPGDAVAMTAAANLLELQGYPGLAYTEALNAVNAFEQAEPTPIEAPSNLLSMYQRLFTYMTTPSSSALPTDVTTSNTKIGYSSANQTITLTATVTSPSSSSSVNEGTVTLSLTGVGSPVSATVLQGTATASYTIPGGTAVGNYVLQANYNGTSNFQSSSDTSQLTIAMTPLTITANNASRQYGQPNSPFTATYGGFANGDTGSTLQGTLTCTTTARQSSAPGSYPILCAGLSSPNYTITYVQGLLTVGAVPLTIIPKNATRAYGATNPSLNTVSSNGFVNGDTLASLNGTLLCATEATPASPAGNYPISCSGLSSPNYAISYIQGVLTVTADALTISVNNQTRQYGATNPPLNSVTYAGFVNGDGPASLSGVLSCATTATQSSPLGIYPITCSGLSSSNYTITYVPGQLTITSPTCASSVTASVAVTRSGFSYSPLSKRYAQTLNLTNTAGSTITGPIYVILDNLSTSAALYNTGGSTACAAPTGSPYVSIAGPIGAGASTNVVLQFSDPTNAAISYTPRFLAGSGQP